MAKVPAVGDVQKMLTRASLTAMVCFTGTAMGAILIGLAYIKPGVVTNPVGGAIFSAVLFALGMVFLHIHKGSPRRQRTVTSVFQKDGEPHMTVRYMDGAENTIPADGAH